MSNQTEESIAEFLANLSQDSTDLQGAYILKFEDFWEKKLWHELTDSLVEYFNTKHSDDERLPIYKKFITSFADKINQLSLVTLALSAAAECKGMLRS